MHNINKAISNFLSVFIYSFIFIVSLFFFLFGGPANKVLAGCPTGSTCEGSTVWDAPAGCVRHTVVDHNDNTTYYYTQAYTRITLYCDSNCAWTEGGDVCDTNTGTFSPQNTNGSCCTSGGTTTPPPCSCSTSTGGYADNCPDDCTGLGCSDNCVYNKKTKKTTCTRSCTCTCTTCTGNCYSSCTPNWGACSVTCGGGLESDGCGNTVVCNTQSCCTPAWGACSKTCGGGTQSDGCGSTRACNTQICGPWWQAKDGDVISSYDLKSAIPTGSYFNLPGAGGYPGIAGYGGSTNLTSLNVSSKGWLAKSTVTNAKTYSYSYFAGLIPDDILALVNSVDNTNVSEKLTSVCVSPDSNGYCWYKYDGAGNGSLPLTLSATDIGTNKVILLVDNADLDVTGNINLTNSSSGTRFFIIHANGDINVDPNTSSLVGLYFADGSLNTGSFATTTPTGSISEPDEGDRVATKAISKVRKG